MKQRIQSIIRSTLLSSTTRIPIPSRRVTQFYTALTPPHQYSYFSSFHRPNSSSSTQVKLALRTLSLSKGFSNKELRDAYFDAAKRCHPDSYSPSTTSTTDTTQMGDILATAGGETVHKTKARMTDMFLEITEAYELLRQHPGGSLSSPQLRQEEEDMDIMPQSEEEFYRQAVRETLGIEAEILEESKKCPMFRLWLKGGSIMAFHFNLFLMRHGGLAPMLGKRKAAELGEGVKKRRKKRGSFGGCIR